MQIRPAATSDLALVTEIDGTIESSRYLHVERSGEALNSAWRMEERAARQKLIEPNRMGDEAAFLLKQIVTGAEEGVARIVESGEGSPVAMMLARPDPAAATFKLIDLRVDSDFRREGMGMALIYQLIQHARETEGIRAVAAETLSNNLPASGLLAKCGFELSGVDTRRWSNHDLVKEAVTLLWYAALD